MALEMSKSKKILFAAACFLAAFAVMGEMGVLPFVYDLYGAFPDHPMLVNYIVSSGSLWMVIGAFLSAWLMRRFSKKSLLIASTAIFSIGGILPGFLPTIPVLIVCRSFMGLGQGITNSVLMALIAVVYLDETKRAGFMGLWNAAAALISTLLSYASGTLAVSGFWCYIPSIIAVVAVVMFIPNLSAIDPILSEKSEKTGTQKAARKPLGKLYWFFLLDYILFTLIYSVHSYYISAYVAEGGLGDAYLAGICTSLSTVGSFILCLFMGKLYGKLRKNLACVVIAVQGASMIVMYFAQSVAMACIGSCLIGASYGLYFSYSYAMAAEIVPAERCADAISFCTGFYGIAFFLCTYIISFVKNLVGTESYTLMYLVFGAFSIIPLALELATNGAYKKMTAMKEERGNES